jgi:hypothetical protein
MVEHLTSKHEALSSNPSTGGNKKDRRRKLFVIYMIKFQSLLCKEFIKRKRLSYSNIRNRHEQVK